MALSTYKVFLMHKTSMGESYEKLVDIKSFPDLGGEPEMIETTTLSDHMQTFIPGVQSLSNGLPFDCNYDPDDYEKLKALEEKEEDYAVWIGASGVAPALNPTGSDGKFEFKGKLTVWLTGGGVNEAIGMKVTIAPSTVITKAEA